MKIKITVLLLLFPCIGILLGQSLRPSYWTMDYISFLQHRGYLWSLSPLEQPYGVREIERELRKEKGELKSDSRYWMDAEYRDRLLYFSKFFHGEGETLFWMLQSGNEFFSTDNFDLYRGIKRGTIGLRVQSWLEVYDTFLLDTRLDENPKYLGKTQSGYASYSEQAYGLLSHKGFQFKLGRDFIRWGVGRDATLLVSDFSRPMDMFSASFSSRYFKFSYFTASLDPSFFEVGGQKYAVGSRQLTVCNPVQTARLPSVGQGSPLRSDRQNRYLTAHRLEIRPWKYLYISLSESILYGGSNFSYDLAYLNPFLFYHGVQLNGPNGGNTIGSINFAFMPKRGIFIYGDLMIDDIQIEKTGPGDLEPNEVGYIIGVNVADPMGIFGLDVYGEYTRITNRTYNTLQPWEKWLHRNQPIGHFLGNDFDRTIAGFNYWPRPQYRFSIEHEKRRRGEGRIEKPFDTPWMDVPIGEDYHEPFPTGVVEKSNIFRLETTWHPRWWLRVFGMLSYWDIENKDNANGEDTGYWEGRFRIEVDWIGKLRVGRTNGER